jgi:arylsulfatase A
MKMSYLWIVPLLWIAADCSAAIQTKNPNVLILYADDLGYGDLGCTNPSSKIPTPNLDDLASQGMLFTDGHSSSGVCTPSRYALLTGRFHWRKFYGIVNAFGESVFSPERLTLPEMLKQKDYKTAAIGKWHLGWGWKAYLKPETQSMGLKQHHGRKVYGLDAFDWTKSIPNGPTAHGFDMYFGDNVINFPPYAWIENDRVTEIPTVMLDTKTFKRIKEGNWECRPGPMVKGWDPYENIPVTTQKGIDYIKKQARENHPFFLYFAFPSPHAPIIPNDEFNGKSEAGPYGDFVYETDDAAGRLVRALKESGQYGNIGSRSECNYSG